MAKIEHHTLNDRAYAALKASLVSGEFRPGQVLVIRTVAEGYGISSTPVREALQRLVAERLLELRPNRSIAVPHLSLEKFTELCRIRCAVEGLAGELAVAHMAALDSRRLEEIAEETERAVERRDSAAYLRLNQSFHFAIYDRANAPLLFEIIQDLWCRVGSFFNELFEDAGFISRANEHHWKIIAALRDQDGPQTRQHIVDDISAAARALVPRLREHVARLHGERSDLAVPA